MTVFQSRQWQLVMRRIMFTQQLMQSVLSAFKMENTPYEAPKRIQDAINDIFLEANLSIENVYTASPQAAYMDHAPPHASHKDTAPPYTALSYTALTCKDIGVDIKQAMSRGRCRVELAVILILLVISGTIATGSSTSSSNTTAVEEVHMSLTVKSQNYMSEYANSSSPEFLAFQSDFCKQIKSVVNSSQDLGEYTDCIVLSLSKGSVKVRFKFVIKPARKLTEKIVTDSILSSGQTLKDSTTFGIDNWVIKNTTTVISITPSTSTFTSTSATITTTSTTESTTKMSEKPNTVESTTSFTNPATTESTTTAPTTTTLPPLIVNLTVNAVAVIGNSFAFQCTVKNVQTLQELELSRDGQVFAVLNTSSSMVTVTQSDVYVTVQYESDTYRAEVTLMQITCSDSGKYECVAKGIGSAAQDSTDLQVTRPPDSLTLEVPLSVEGVTKTNPVCRATSNGYNPVMTFTWVLRRPNGIEESLPLHSDVTNIKTSLCTSSGNSTLDAQGYTGWNNTDLCCQLTDPNNSSSVAKETCQRIQTLAGLNE